MSSRAADRPWPTSLRDLPSWVETTEGFAPLLAALRARRAATIDGAWHSAAALTAAALGLAAPRTLLVVLAHPRDLDAWSDDLVSFTGQRPALFPAWDALPTIHTVLDEVGGLRLRLLRHLESEPPPRFVLTTMQALLQPVPSREQLGQRRLALRLGAEIGLEDLVAWLGEHGYQRMDAVELPGEFSRRGGIVDVYSPDAEAPYRIEFFGDAVESIRQFAADTQRSLGELQAVEITARHVAGALGSAASQRGHLCDYLPAETWTMLVETAELREQGRHYLERVPDLTGLYSPEAVLQQLVRFPSIAVSGLPAGSMETTWHLRVESVERFSGDVLKVRDELDAAAANDFVLIACHNEAEKKRLGDVLAAGQLARQGRLHLVVGHVAAGFRWIAEEGSLVVLGDHELFHRERAQAIVPRRRLEARAIDSFLDLREDDLVVHLSHGIARFRGMELLEKNGLTEEHLVLE
ncbi:MAG: transcription-repair coupling factor, partial [Gemmataceae bacterium]|nr:transcription-repair coupling factor [Gemmataceae bacterium]